MQLFILSAFLFTHKKGNRISNELLAVFLLSNGLVVLDVLQLHSGLYLTFPHLVTSGFSTTLLFGPLLYFYTVSVTLKEFKLRRVHLLHVVPFVAHWIVLFPAFFIAGSTEKIEMIHSGIIFNAEASTLGYALIHLQIIIYLVASVYVLSRDNQRTKQSQNLNWLWVVILGFLVMWTGDLVLFLTSQTLAMPAMVGAGFQFLAMLLYFIFVNIAIFLGLRQPDLFSAGKIKYTNSQLTDDQRKSLIRKLENHMSTDEPFLSSSVSVDSVASKLNILPRYLSQAINETYGQNFYDFINSYRIDKAKNILLNGKDPGKTFLEVMYEVGFNSKSAFNKAFKKHTGSTPSAFKKQSN